MAFEIRDIVGYVTRADDGSEIPGACVEYAFGKSKPSLFSSVENGRIVDVEVEPLGDDIRQKIIEAAQAYILLDEYGLFGE